MEKAIVLAASAIGAGIAVTSGIGTGVGQGIAAGYAAAAVGRQPEAQGDIIKTMIIGQGVAETTGLYGFFVSLALLFFNPIVGKL